MDVAKSAPGSEGSEEQTTVKEPVDASLHMSKKEAVVPPVEEEYQELNKNEGVPLVGENITRGQYTSASEKSGTELSQVSRDDSSKSCSNDTVASGSEKAEESSGKLILDQCKETDVASTAEKELTEAEQDSKLPTSDTDLKVTLQTDTKDREQAEVSETDTKKDKGQIEETETVTKKGKGQIEETETDTKKDKGQIEETETVTKKGKGQIEETETDTKKDKVQIEESETDTKKDRGQVEETDTKKDSEQVEEVAADDPGNESSDSDMTIDIDQSDIEKAFDKTAAADVRQGSSEKPKGSKDASGVVRIDGGDVVEAMDTGLADDVSSKVREGEKPGSQKDMGEEKQDTHSHTNPTETSKVHQHQSESFHSFDLPLHPINERRRSRSRQRSEPGHPPGERITEGLPPERFPRSPGSPSVASNKSEESLGSGGRDRRGPLSEIERERRKSGASSKAESKTSVSTKMVRAGFEIRPGFKLEAMDFSKKWYPAKIVAVDEDDMDLHIHFEGWNSRFDEWIPYDSDRLRPSTRTSRKDTAQDTFTVGDTVLARWSDTRYYQGKIRGVNSNGSYRVRFYDGLEKSVQAGNIREMPEELRLIVSPKGYGIGDEVLARWNDCRYYPAKILSIKKNGAFRVLFYDGIEKSVQPFNVREMPVELKAQDFFKQFKDQIKASEEKNRQREKRERARAAIEDEEPEVSPTSSASGSGLKRKISPTSTPGATQSKRPRHDSTDSVGSKSAGTVSRKTEPVGEKVDLHVEQSEAEKVEVDYRKVRLKRGSVGYFIKGFVYIKHRDGFNSWVLRCRVGHCTAKAVIIRKTGKAVIKQSNHSHPPPKYDTIDFCTTEAKKDMMKSPLSEKRRFARQVPLTPPQSEGSVASETPPSAATTPSSTTTPEANITPLSQLLSPEDLAKIKEGDKKRIREPLIVDSAMGVLRDPLKIHAPKELIIDLDHNKYKCEVADCGKSFRKATLLEYHKKYYHVNTTTLSTSVSTAAASKVLNKSRKRLSTSPTKSTSRRSSEEIAPAKVTRSQRSSAPSELEGPISPGPAEPMSPPIRSPSERKKLPDTPGREKTRSKSGSSSKPPEVRVAKTPETRIPIEAKAGKIPETRIPKSPEARLLGKSPSRGSEGRRSLDGTVSEGKAKTPSPTERARSLSGTVTSKPIKTVSAVPRLPDVKGPKFPDKGEDKLKEASSKEVIKHEVADRPAQDVKSLNTVIKSEPAETPEAPTTETLEPVTMKQVEPSPQTTKPKSADEVIIHITSTGEPSGKVVDPTTSKIRNDKAKIKHKKKHHRHKHEKGKEDRSRERSTHKSERHRKMSDKSKISDTEPGKSSQTPVKNEPLEHSDDDIKMEEHYEDMDHAAMEEEVVMMEQPEEKEIINCVCGYMEEEGFMLQCERCYCWQHGCCEGVNQTTAPKKYVCTFCRHPRGERVQSKYHYDQEWFKTGKMARYGHINQDDILDTSDNMLTMHNLMADVDAINEILYGLQHKMIILRNPNHPELALWAHPWRTGEEWDHIDGHHDVDGHHHHHHDTLDNPDADLSNMSTMRDTSNLDITLDSLSTSMQSIEVMETSMDNSVSRTEGCVSMDDAQSSGDVTARSGDVIITQSGDTITQISDATSHSLSSEAESSKTRNSGLITDVSGAIKASTSNSEVRPELSETKTGNTADGTSKSASELGRSNQELVESLQMDVKPPSDKASTQGTQEGPLVLPETSKPVADKDDVEKTTVETSDDPAGKIKDDSSLPSQPAAENQTPAYVSTGSVFGTQSLKEPKPASGSDDKKEESTSRDSEGKLSAALTPLSSVDHDKPGPSGLQQSVVQNKPDASSVLKPGAMVDNASDPQTSDDVKPKSGENVAMETDASDKQDVNQLLSTDVKVTGSSVWTAVQGSNPVDPSTSSAPEIRVPAPIPPPAVCQANLMEHIQTMHEELFDRLALVEEQVEALEIAYAQKNVSVNAPPLGSDQESLALKRKMSVLMSDLEKLSNIDLTSHN